MNLTRDEARERARTVRVESYDIEVDLTAGETTSRRRRWHGSPPPRALRRFLDLVAPAVRDAHAHGEPVDISAAFDGVRIALTGLRADNEMRFVADCAYMEHRRGAAPRSSIRSMAALPSTHSSELPTPGASSRCSPRPTSRRRTPSASVPPQPTGR
jgi:hypothetical protein